MQIIDITRPISPAIAVWPGDSPYSQDWAMSIADGDTVNVSTLTMSTHTGTHTDAPLHFSVTGKTIGQMPLDSFIGPATVIHLDRTGPIRPEDFAGIDLSQIERLLVRSPGSARPDDVWEEDIVYLTLEAAAVLGKHGVRLFGTDAPSVDPIHSTTLQAHHALYRHNIAILENLQLAHVAPGVYELIALPLNLPTDGSPVRAVLRPLSDA